jgi:hypothetical protein
MNYHGQLLIETTIGYLVVAFVHVCFSRGRPWGRAAGILFLVFNFAYTGLGLSDDSFDGRNFVANLLIYIACFLLSLNVAEGKFRFLSTERALGRLKSWASYSSWQSKIVLLFVLSMLVPLLVPTFRLDLLLHPPQLDFAGVFLDGGGFDSGFVQRISKYASLLLLAPFLIALGRPSYSIGRLLILFVFMLYVEYVSNAYLSRSSILLYLFLLSACLVAKSNGRPFRAFLIIAPAFMIAGLFASWYLAFRLNGVSGSDLSRMIHVMVDVETNFPRDAGVPLYNSGVRGSWSSYFLWFFTLPVPKALFGQFVDLRINEDIAYAVTGLLPGQSSFFVPLAGNFFSSLYSLGSVFWMEALLAGFVTGYALKIAGRYSHAHMLRAFIIFSASYTFNRAGMSGFAPQLVNCIVWLPLLWDPLFTRLARRRVLGRPIFFKGARVRSGGALHE